DGRRRRPLRHVARLHRAADLLRPGCPLRLRLAQAEPSRVFAWGGCFRWPLSQAQPLGTTINGACLSRSASVPVRSNVRTQQKLALADFRLACVAPVSYATSMRSLTVRLPDSLVLEIERESQSRRVSKSD